MLQKSQFSSFIFRGPRDKNPLAYHRFMFGTKTKSCGVRFALFNLFFCAHRLCFSSAADGARAAHAESMRWDMVYDQFRFQTQF